MAHALKTLSAAFAAAAALAAQCGTLTWTGADSDSPSEWNTTAKNWQTEGDSPTATAWVHGSSAIFAPDAALSISVTEEVQVRNITVASPQAISLTDGGGGLISSPTTKPPRTPSPQPTARTST